MWAKTYAVRIEKQLEHMNKEIIFSENKIVILKKQK